MGAAWTADDLLEIITAPTDWRNVPAVNAPDEWDELRTWVIWVKDRYLLDHRVIPPCWYLHEPLVDLLTALRDHHRYVFTALQPATAATEWHRVFRDLEPRLRDWVARTGCTRDEHRPEMKVAWPDDATRWQAHVAEDEQRRTAAEQAQPLD